MAEKTKTSYGYLSLFRFCSALDYVILALAITLALASGSMFPLSTLIFSDIIGCFIRLVSSSTGPKTYPEEALKVFKQEITVVLTYFAVLCLASFLVAYLMMAMWVWFSERQGKSIRIAYAHSLMSQDMTLMDTETAGELASRLSTNCASIQEGLGDKLGLIIMNYAQFLLCFIMAFIQCWQLAAVMCAAIPAMAVLGMVMGKGMGVYSERSTSASTEASSHAQEVLAAIKTVASFSAEHEEIDRYNRLCDKVRQFKEKMGLVEGVGFGAMMVIMFGTYGLGFWYGSTLIVSGVVPHGGVVMGVAFAIIMGAFSLSNTSQSVSAISAATAGAQKVLSIIDRKPAICHSSTDLLLDISGENILFDNVDFAYPSRPDTKVLKSFNLEIVSGQATAIVGPSGSGKSTLAQLVFRLYQPTAGHVRVGGMPLEDLQLHHLRRQISVVPQDAVLFDTSVYNNVAMGLVKERPITEVTRKEVEEACKLAQAHEFVMSLPLGYDTEIGERGVSLSGGQRQRLAIARAIISNPSILIFDEATAALDNSSEAAVQAAIDSVSKGRTTITIAHRLSTIRHVDYVAVMQAGELMEYGRYADLIESDSKFAELVREQSVSPVRDAKKAEARTETKPDLADKSDDPLKFDQVSESSSRIFLRVMQLNLPEFWFALPGILCAVLNGLSYPFMSMIFAGIQTAFALPVASEMVKEINFYVMLFAVGGVALFFVILAKCLLLAMTSSRLVYRMKALSFSNILYQPMSWFDEHPSGAVASLLTTETEAMAGISGQFVGSLLTVVTTVSLGMGYSFYCGWQLTLAMLGVFPVLALSSAVYVKSVEGFGRFSQDAVSNSGKKAFEMVQEIKTIQFLSAEEHFKQQYADSLAIPYQAGVRKAFVSSLAHGFSQAMFLIAYIVAYGTGAYLVYNGIYTFSDMNTVLFTTIFSASAVGEVAAMAPNVGKALVGARKVLSFLDMRSSMDSRISKGRIDAPKQVDVQLEAVSFSYPSRPTRRVLDNIDIAFRQGEKIALVGASGSGKSTVASLLCRFYDPSKGAVILDGTRLDEWDLRTLRNQMAIVTQDPVLFSRSVVENIRLGNQNVPLSEVHRVCTLVGMSDFVESLPEGYNTQCGLRGTQLSGGQRQRIAIARAYLKQPKLLIFDEATSALDTSSERLIQQSMSAFPDMTMVMVAHRLSTVVHCDRIYVFGPNGCIVESGCHSELMSKGGVYADLVTGNDFE